MNWTCPACGSVNPAPKTQRAEVRCAACDATFAAEYSPAQEAPPVVIERTSKRWKRQMVWGWSVMLLSVGGCTVGMTTIDPKSPAQAIPILVGTLGFFIGAALHFSARAGAWWDNG
jgi:hypothetical protein